MIVLTIDVLNDSDSIFQPNIGWKIWKKTWWSRRTVIKLYSKGMSTKDIELIVEQNYYFQIGKDFN